MLEFPFNVTFEFAHKFEADSEHLADMARKVSTSSGVACMFSGFRVYRLASGEISSLKKRWKGISS